MPTLDDAVRVTQALAGMVPLFVAISCNSPLSAGRRSPWRSARSEQLRRMLWGGPTPRLASTAEFRGVHALHQLENEAKQRFLWEVAPVPALGTVEVRSFDSQPDPVRTLAYAALVQGLAGHVLAGGELPRANESLERHNRWSAMEFGTNARFLVEGRDAPVDVLELVSGALELARPVLARMGNEAWLAPIERLLEEEQPVDALIDAFSEGGVDAVLDASTVSVGAG
jgi:carboxylate-amine ligase